MIILRETLPQTWWFFWQSCPKRTRIRSTAEGFSDSSSSPPFRLGVVGNVRTSDVQCRGVFVSVTTFAAHGPVGVVVSFYLRVFMYLLTCLCLVLMSQPDIWLSKPLEVFQRWVSQHSLWGKNEWNEGHPVWLLLYSLYSLFFFFFLNVNQAPAHSEITLYMSWWL